MNERERREQIVAKWMENTQRPNHFIARDLKIPRRTVDTVLKRYVETLSTAQKPRTVEHGGARDPGLDRKIIKTICKNRSMSERDIAKKNLQVSQW